MGGRTGRRILLAGLVLLIALAAGVAWWWTRDRKPTSRIRNVVLISIDTCRSDHLGCYGATRPATPNIDAVAQQGTLFENVTSPVPLTLPAHCSIMTGTNPTYHGVHDNLNDRLSPANLTLAEVLHGNGFATGAIVSAAVLDSRLGLNQGFDTYLDKMSVREGDENSAERPGGETTQLALQWLDQHQENPFFLFLHYFDPHDPYRPPEPFASQYADDLYSGEIAFTDSCIGQVIGKLKALGLYDSTLLIITGDHGEMLGEHGEKGHGFFIYQSALRVPLVVRLPGQETAHRASDAVGLVDLVPTVCSLLQVDRPPVLHGEDLSPALLGKPLPFPPRTLYCESLYATRYDANSLLGFVGEQWKYIQTTRPELYELPRDPRESNNLAGRSAEQVQSLRQKMQQTLDEQNRQLADSNIQLDDATRRRLESLGYVGGRADTGTTPADFTQDPGKDDPKDLIDFYNAHVALTARMRENDFGAARAICQQMIAKRPQSWIPYYHLAEMEMAAGDLASARTNLLAVLDRKGPNHAGAHNRLGLIAQSQGQRDEAIAHFREAVKLRPLFQGAHSNLGDALRAKGDWQGATSAYRQALSADPNFLDAHLKLAEALHAQNRFEEAIGHFRQAIRIKSDVREAHYNLGTTLLRVGQTEEALKEFRETMRLAPQWPLAMAALARTLATAPDARLRDGKEALRLAERAVEMTQRRDPSSLDALAAAQAESGQFAEAAKTEQTAIDLATAARADRLLEQFRPRLEAYQRGQPYRTPVPNGEATPP